MDSGTDKRDEMIYQSWVNGETMKRIGERFGISQPTVSRIIKRMQEKDEQDPREFIIKNGSAEVFLTAIEEPDRHPTVYRYGTTDPRKALRLRWADAERIARERHATICYWKPSYI